jgi:phosphopentomutase
MKAFLIVLDSVGIGAAPDAASYGDAGANTLAHTAQAVSKLQAQPHSSSFSLPTLQTLGLGNIPPLLPGGLPIPGVPPHPRPVAAYGAMQERSQGKDTTTGHWEMAGLLMDPGFHLFPKGPPSFPAGLIAEFERGTGRRVIGNKAASGLAIIDELGPRQMQDGAWIVYTSGDSVFQIAAHEAIIPLEELYAACRTARELCNPLVVGRVIARPYLGTPGAFLRTENRRDFSYPLPEPTILDRLLAANIPVITVGKLDDIFAGRGMSESFHVENSHAAIDAVLNIARRPTPCFCFTNLIDFDMLYGHRRDPIGYAHALQEADRFLGNLIPLLDPEDLLIITADHGNDPTFRGTDHTREFVPLLVRGPRLSGINLGIRDGFYDLAQTLAAFFGIPATPRGRSFLPSQTQASEASATATRSVPSP